MTEATVSAHADANNYVVDEAGYVISTRDSLATTASAIASLAENLSGVTTPLLLDLLGANDAPVAEIRADYARRLRQHIDRLSELAAALEGPMIDERHSGRVGWDAKHSIL